jgi:hypothetical protein
MKECSIPLIGGPFDGDFININKGKLSNEVPLYHKYKFHIYKLLIKETEKITSLHYEFTGNVVDFDDVAKYKVD